MRVTLKGIATLRFSLAFLLAVVTVVSLAARFLAEDIERDTVVHVMLDRADEAGEDTHGKLDRIIAVAGLQASSTSPAFWVNGVGNQWYTADGLEGVFVCFETTESRTRVFVAIADRHKENGHRLCQFLRKLRAELDTLQ